MNWRRREQISEIFLLIPLTHLINVEMKPIEGSEIRELSTPENGEGLRQSYHWTSGPDIESDLVPHPAANVLHHPWGWG